MQKTSNQSGFSIIEGLIVLVVVVAVIGVGFLVYKRSNSKTAKNLDSVKDTEVVQQDLDNKSESLNKDLNSDTAKLDETTKEVQ